MEIYDLNNNLINVIKSYPSQIIYLVEFNKYNDLIIYTLEPYGKYLFVNYKFDKDLICIKRMNY